MTIPAPVSDETKPKQTSFAETALALGGKSADEARRTGAIDTADDQVEALFAPQYQTVNSRLPDVGRSLRHAAADACGCAAGDG